jgi:hypothetical protein
MDRRASTGDLQGDGAAYVGRSDVVLLDLSLPPEEHRLRKILSRPLGPGRVNDMERGTDWLLATPALLATLRKHEGNAIQMVDDGYFSLWTLGRLASGVGEQLRRDNREPLGATLAALGEVMRREAKQAQRQGLVKELDDTPWGQEPPWEVVEAEKILFKIMGEVHAICLGLVFSIDMVPDDWQAFLCRSTGHLLCALGDLMGELGKKPS